MWLCVSQMMFVMWLCVSQMFVMWLCVCHVTVCFSDVCHVTVCFSDPGYRPDGAECQQPRGRPSAGGPEEKEEIPSSDGKALLLDNKSRPNYHFKSFFFSFLFLWGKMFFKINSYLSIYGFGVFYLYMLYAISVPVASKTCWGIESFLSPAGHAVLSWRGWLCWETGKPQTTDRLQRCPGTGRLPFLTKALEQGILKYCLCCSFFSVNLKNEESLFHCLQNEDRERRRSGINMPLE